MTKWLIGYVQANDEYVYVANITAINIGIATSTDSALNFKSEDNAKGVLKYIKSVVVNQDYKVLKVTTDVKEVE